MAGTAEGIVVARDTNGEPVFIDENGEPLIRISYQASELIGLPNYSNITVGPANITVYVRKGQTALFTNDEEKNALADVVNELAQLVETEIIGRQRTSVIEDLNTSK